MRQIFCLEWTHYESRVRYYFLAPDNTTEQDFKLLCNNLLQEAAERACQEEWLVGWNSVVESLSEILPNHGYDLVKLPIVSYWGGVIINGTNDIKTYGESGELVEQMSQETLKIITQHNIKVNERRNETIQS